jgi:hypothetical protein
MSIKENKLLTKKHLLLIVDEQLTNLDSSYGKCLEYIGGVYH